MEIAEIKDRKAELTNSIANLIDQFQKECGVRITDITLETSAVKSFEGQVFFHPSQVQLTVAL